MGELFSERNDFIEKMSNNEYSVEFRSAIVTSFFNQYHSLEEGELFYHLKDVMDLFGIEQKPQVHDDATLRFNKEATLNYFKSCSWNHLFDFIEYVLELDNNKAPDLSDKYNRIFRLHGCKYRLVNGKAIPIVNDLEINVISQALQTGIASVDASYREAIILLSEKIDPDYNAIIAKASNAIESMIITIAQDNSVKSETLGKAINQLKSKGVTFDQDMEEIIKKVYKYACNAGIRHGGAESVEATEEDALLIMVISAAVIKYLNSLRTTKDF